jgi:hypothetical protein
MKFVWVNASKAKRERFYYAVITFNFNKKPVAILSGPAYSGISHRNTSYCINQQPSTKSKSTV